MRSNNIPKIVFYPEFLEVRRLKNKIPAVTKPPAIYYNFLYLYDPKKNPITRTESTLHDLNKA